MDSPAGCLLNSVSVIREPAIIVDLLQGKKKDGRLALARQLMGNTDEVTDLRLIGPPEAPSHLALASNSPAMRVFDLQTMNCTATLAGHTDTVLVLDATRTKGALRLPALSRGPPSIRLACNYEQVGLLPVRQVQDTSALHMPLYCVSLWWRQSSNCIDLQPDAAF